MMKLGRRNTAIRSEVFSTLLFILHSNAEKMYLRVVYSIEVNYKIMLNFVFSQMIDKHRY